MPRPMLFVRHDLQILRSVVSRVPVHVVHDPNLRVQKTETRIAVLHAFDELLELHAVFARFGHEPVQGNAPTTLPRANSLAPRERMFPQSPKLVPGFRPTPFS